MARELASILGTERDRLNCPFYFRIGACRHGDRCSRTHLRPNFSQTILIKNLYTAAPQTEEQRNIPDDDFEDFIADIVKEMRKYGHIEEVVVSQNMGEHLFGNVYIKYVTEEEADKAMAGITGRYYNTKLLTPEYSPVLSFEDAVCGMFRTGRCERGDYCNFMHCRDIPSYIKRKYRKKKYRSRSRSRDHSRSRSPKRHRSRSNDRRRHSRSRSRDRAVRPDRVDRSSRDRSPRSRSRSEEPEMKKEAPKRESSVERRARFARMNEERQKKAAEAAAAAVGGTEVSQIPGQIPAAVPTSNPQ